MVAESEAIRQLYLQQNVLQAARDRIGWVFSNFKTVKVSISGGKDSTVLAELCWREAQERGRLLHVFSGPRSRIRHHKGEGAGGGAKSPHWANPQTDLY